MITSSEFVAYTKEQEVGYPLDAAGTPDRIIEIGPGCGTGTLELMAHFPGTEIICLEPDAAARNAVLWRLFDHPDREQVSVLPLTVEAARSVIAPADLVVAHHVICQVPIVQRDRFWSAVRDLLAPDGVALIDSHLGASDGPDVPRRLSAEGRSGQFTVQRWFSATHQDSCLQVSNEYTFADGNGRILFSHRQVSKTEHTDTVAERARITGAGLHLTDLDDGWLSLTPGPVTPTHMERQGGIRSLQINDAADVLTAFDSSTDMARQGTVTTMDQAREYVERLVTEDRHAAYAITDGDRLVGLVAMTIDQPNRSGWFWYWMNASHRGRGWMSVAAAEVADIALTQLGLERLELGHRANNPASGAVARAAGFRYEGTERGKFLIDGQRVDVAIYGRLRDDGR
ncbi:RimJ/RimL family protein N-acetyltransferase [Branchiibius hedensis]|uniref:Protein N-acetyltransferase, RimJ/RimL family n=1 Tax=Branchiibius hedensis TaxID=672460 RepID=A0A2Y8ZXK4_9MICO|nr:GNAT family N-acetyltransferase [Branchiibius hedensis]PWJ27207.1 RimJ/RimL family protein N-acetyltransferase [Branchiibius hedensis]SSA36018.1 Protein N-acetyltransferase, RimJ/RimL family [Branchiibius hedensis]